MAGEKLERCDLRSTVLSHLLTEYAKRKKYIDRDRGWWFPQTQVEVKANNMSSLALKLNFELQGKGPLRIGSPNYLWFENSIFDILQTVKSRIGTDGTSTHLMEYVIDFYQTILAGDYSKDQYGRYQKRQSACMKIKRLMRLKNISMPF